jgi:transposase
MIREASREGNRERIKEKYADLAVLLNERSRRCWAATEARAVGSGGITMVAGATGLTRTTIRAGLAELANPQQRAPAGRIRKIGGGRKKLVEHDTGLLPALNSLIEPTERGDPESSLRWTTKSTTNLADALTKEGHPVSQRAVWALLHEQHYSLQSNRKTEEGTNHPDRDAQFKHISKEVKKLQSNNQPVISVDTKKKEVIGNCKNNGREWRKAKNPRKVDMHDFPDPKLGKVAPYGVYDLSKNEGWVNVGIDHDTASFAVESIRRWWTRMGRTRYPNARALMITADCGGSNANRNRLWKVELQQLANEINMTIHVSHFPPGTSKWNKIEHRLFSFISRNWRGQPLIDRATVVNLIANTKTKTGLVVQAMLDENQYETGRKISDDAMAALNLIPESFHGEWNYRIEPRG